MSEKSRSYTFDWREDERGYSWVVAESCPIDGFILRTGHSPDFLSLVNSLLSMTWDIAVDKYLFYSLRRYPLEYTAANINGYSKVLGASRGTRGQRCFALSPLVGGTTGIAYVTPVFLEHPNLEPMALRELAEALTKNEHPEFWTPAITKAIRGISGEQSTPNNVKASLENHALKTSQDSTQPRRWEKWMAESIPRGTIVYATDGSAGQKSGISYSYVTSTGKFYAGEDKDAEGNSFRAEFKALRAARRAALKDVARGHRVLILSDNNSAINAAQKMDLPHGIRGDMIEIRWVKGHSGHPLNQAADSIASLAYKKGLSAEEKQKRMAQVVREKIPMWQKHLESLEEKAEHSAL